MPDASPLVARLRGGGGGMAGKGGGPGSSHALASMEAFQYFNNDTAIPVSTGNSAAHSSPHCLRLPSLHLPPLLGFHSLPSPPPSYCPSGTLYHPRLPSLPSPSNCPSGALFPARLPLKSGVVAEPGLKEQGPVPALLLYTCSSVSKSLYHSKSSFLIFKVG